MRPDPEEFRSAFIRQKGLGEASGRSQPGSYLSGTASAGQFASGLQSSFALPDGAGRKLQESYAADGDAFSSGLMDAGLDLVNAGRERSMALGAQGVSGLQNLAAAKRSATIARNGIQSGATASMIGSLIDMGGSIGGAAASAAAKRAAVRGSSSSGTSSRSGLYW